MAASDDKNAAQILLLRSPTKHIILLIIKYSFYYIYGVVLLKPSLVLVRCTTGSFILSKPLTFGWAKLTLNYMRGPFWAYQ